MNPIKLLVRLRRFQASYTFGCTPALDLLLLYWLVRHKHGSVHTQAGDSA